MTAATTELLDRVEIRLSRYFDAGSERAAAHSPHYRDLWRALEASAAGGKRLRPRLLLGAYTALDGRDHEQAIEVAAAVELLHTALLLHDDVIDGDLERRGAPNLIGSFAAVGEDGGLAGGSAIRWGQSAAILAGDLLLTSAMRIAAGLELDRSRSERLLTLIDDSVYRAAAGELADITYAAGLAVPSDAEIRGMMADKTAHYSLELPLRAAAILAGAPEPLGDRLGAIGRSIGLVFQMRDDLLGVFGRAAETGKSTINDLREGKQTMLVTHARASDAWTRAAGLFGSAELDEAGAAELRVVLEESGARARVEAEIVRERDAALALIDAAGLPAALVDLLTADARSAAERQA